MTRNTRQSWLVYALLIVFLLGAVLPFIGIFLTAFKTTPELVNGPFALPETWRWQNFVDAWEGARFATYFASSVIVVVPVVIIASILSTMAGYAFGTMRFRGESVLLLLILLGLMMPFEAVIIPLWQVMGSLGLRNTYWAIILPQVALSFAFGTFWMRSHFKNVPSELIDAAVVDGCTVWGVLWRVLLPISTPALLSMIVLVFMWTWNEFFLVLVMVTGDQRTLPVGLALLRGRYASEVPIMAAGAMIVLLPVLLLYLVFQRNFIQGIASGAVKG